MAIAALTRATWRVLPTRSPTLVHHCRRCGCQQGFRHDGCFRVNANGRRLDVWLRHACERCGHTWHVPIYERVAVSEVPELAALERDDAALLDRWAWTLSARHPCAPDEDFVVEACPLPAHARELVLAVPWPLRVRTGRVLARVLGVSRSAVKARVADRRVLRRSVSDGLVIALRASPPAA